MKISRSRQRMNSSLSLSSPNFSTLTLAQLQESYTAPSNEQPTVDLQVATVHEPCFSPCSLPPLHSTFLQLHLDSPSNAAMSETTKSPPAPRSNLPSAAAEASHAAVKTAISTSNEDVTVLSDTTNFNVKHPLYSPWTLWFDSASKQDKAKSWEEALSKVISFQSVEEFWG